MILGRTKRPRNVDSPRAAAILYGDWGTSKAYVIGLAFAVAGYSSFWLILAMSTGELAVAVSVPTAITVVVLAFFSLSHLGEAWHNVKPLSGGFWHNWNGFVGIVLAVSGVEAIVNATSVMKLDRGSSEEHPSVRKISTPAIFSVVLEVSIFTARLGLGMHALGGLQIDHGDVNAPGHPGVRDYMLRYMAEIFVGGQLGPIFGQVAGWIVTSVFGFLLLSAVNTAIVDLIAISFFFGHIVLKSDPFSFFGQHGVQTASLVFDLDRFKWNDAVWVEERKTRYWPKQPVSIYEVHLGSWGRVPEENNRYLSYIEFADRLIPYVKEMGYSHVELLPVAEHPFDGSSGYQVTGYFAPSSRFVNPDEFRHFVDRCHQEGIGVILDWVPGHFPKMPLGWLNFDGTPLYEHADPRQG